MNKEIHEIQGRILKSLLLRDGGRFAELKPHKTPSDQFTFHLKRLIDGNIVKKEEDGSYHLTASGKEYANRYDSDSGAFKVEKQAKLGALVVAFRKKNGVRQYVAQTRLKQPFFGYRGFITGKIKWGENVEETAARELLEETGLVGNPRLHSIYHEHIYSKGDELLEDKYFFICVAENPEGELQRKFEGGENGWLSEEEFLKGDIFYDMKDLFSHIKSENCLAFSEHSYTVEKY